MPLDIIKEAKEKTLQKLQEKKTIDSEKPREQLVKEELSAFITALKKENPNSKTAEWLTENLDKIAEAIKNNQEKIDSLQKIGEFFIKAATSQDFLNGFKKMTEFLVDLNDGLSPEEQKKWEPLFNQWKESIEKDILESPLMKHLLDNDPKLAQNIKETLEKGRDSLMDFAIILGEVGKIVKAEIRYIGAQKVNEVEGLAKDVVAKAVGLWATIKGSGKDTNAIKQSEQQTQKQKQGQEVS